MAKSESEHEAELIAKIKGRIAAIRAVTIPPMTYVLAWEDNRFVGPPDDRGEPKIVPFEEAIFFDGQEAAALDWLRNGRTDSNREAPDMVLAILAQHQAINELEIAISHTETGKA